MTLLALDAGGTNTRAVALGPAGDVLGYGRGSAGSPTAATVTGAADGVEAAVVGALGSSFRTGEGRTAVIAMAGEQTSAYVAEVTARLVPYGVTRVVLEHDILALFCSGTPAASGYALIAGTGTVAARVVDGSLDRVVGGRGWLLGDAGGGFWIGRRVVRAVVAALDGQAPATALVPPVLAALGVVADVRTASGRTSAIRQLVSVVYAQRPVALAALAPLAFAAPDDPVARGIVVAASQALADLVATVRVPELDGPVVVGGSVVVRGLLAAPPDLARDLVPPAGDTPVIAVPDGLVGAAVLALRHTGSPVDAAGFAQLQAQVRARSV